MRLATLVFYAALALGANHGLPWAAAAAPLGPELKQGDMRKLVVAAPAPVSDLTFLDETGAERKLSEWRGKALLVNFWATWCAPCRKEMPALESLQRAFADRPFEVVTIATGRNPPAAVERFFSETGINALPRFTDPGMALSRSMAVLGLPVSVLVDREGREVARVVGDAQWDGEDARRVIEALID